MVRIVSARLYMDDTQDNRDAFGWAAMLFNPQAPYDGSYDLKKSATRRARNKRRREARLRRRMGQS